MNAIRFLTTVANGVHHELFKNEGALKQVCEKIVIPNLTMREDDEEMFELNWVEYVRRDTEGSDSDTRRRAAAELVKSLTAKFPNEASKLDFVQIPLDIPKCSSFACKVSGGMCHCAYRPGGFNAAHAHSVILCESMFVEQVTQLFTGYISNMLQQYAQSPAQNWKAKDCAIYLVMALTVRGKTAAQGATTTNQLVNVLDFFSQHVLPELQSQQLDERPVLKADALKYLTLFRSQIPKDTCMEVSMLAVMLECDQHGGAAISHLLCPADLSETCGPVGLQLQCCTHIRCHRSGETFGSKGQSFHTHPFHSCYKLYLDAVA